VIETIMTARFNGGCACGAIRYESAADPQFQAQCQCRDCQRATGTGHADILSFAEKDLNLSGQLSFHEVTGGRGKTVSRGFCAKCGSPVLWRFAVNPGIAVVMAGSLDDPSVFLPQAVMFASQGHVWDYLNPGLPKFEKLPSRPDAPSSMPASAGRT
jgi:hypothetical protein